MDGRDEAPEGRAERCFACGRPLAPRDWQFCSTACFDEYRRRRKAYRARLARDAREHPGREEPVP